jgi:hypothetical protein
MRGVSSERTVSRDFSLSLLWRQKQDVVGFGWRKNFENSEIFFGGGVVVASVLHPPRTSTCSTKNVLPFTSLAQKCFDARRTVSRVVSGLDVTSFATTTTRLVVNCQPHPRYHRGRFPPSSVSLNFLRLSKNP